MSFRNREIEVKILVKGVTNLTAFNKELESAVDKIYPNYEDISGKSFDLYWSTKGTADFVRLRRFPEGAVMTLKSTDRGDTVNRIEIDIKVENPRDTEKFLSILLDHEPRKLSKRYMVYFLENEDTTISVYQITGDENVFVEVEGRSLKRVKELTKAINSMLVNKEMFKVNKSLYQIFIEKEGLGELVSVEEFLAE